MVKKELWLKPELPLAVHLLHSTSASHTGTGEFELEILRRLFHTPTLMEFIPLGFFSTN